MLAMLQADKVIVNVSNGATTNVSSVKGKRLGRICAQCHNQMNSLEMSEMVALKMSVF